MKIKKRIHSSLVAMIINVVLAYIAYGLCRLEFLAENWETFRSSLSCQSVWQMIHGSWMFDTSAIVYTNALYILMMTIPLHYKETPLWQKTAKWIFVVVNALAIIVNLCDSVYFQFTGRRTTVTVFSEFSNEGNLGSILGVELLRHWYLVAMAAILIFALIKLYVKPEGKMKLIGADHPKGETRSIGANYPKYYALHAATFLCVVPLCIFGMRGGATTAVRPITISNANQYVDTPQEAALILNTPFSLIRTIGKKIFTVPRYMSPEDAAKVYSALHSPKAPKVPNDLNDLKVSKVSSDSSDLSAASAPLKKNIAIIIIESFGREYIGGFNHWLDNGKYKGYTPFTDSLMQHSATYLYSFCNGRKSIDGMPSILSSIPMFVEPFFLTPASMNKVSGIAGELSNWGYHSAFFHGAANGSMGFQAFARATGFNDYFGRTEFNADKRFRGDDDFDGTWAIWDEPFMQFYATKMGEMEQPFVTALFTASSHHPFVIPDEYKATFPEEHLPIHKCIRYTDNALRQFFAKAKTMPWYNNTIFVITSDHTNMSDHDYYQTSLGGFCSPIIFFDPSGDIKPGMRNAIAQQIDIMPTLLSYLGYDKPFVAFGCDLFNTPPEKTWAVNYQGGIYQYVEGEYLLQFDGEKTKAIYRFRTDLLLKHNLVGKIPPAEQRYLELRAKAIIQDYMTRMTTDNLTYQNQ